MTASMTLCSVSVQTSRSVKELLRVSCPHELNRSALQHLLSASLHRSCSRQSLWEERLQKVVLLSTVESSSRYANRMSRYADSKMKLDNV